jgi:hypothetical protein
MVTVAHPYRRLGIDPCKERRALADLEISMSVFTALRSTHATAACRSQELHAVADPENRHIELQPSLIEWRSICVIYR